MNHVFCLRFIFAFACSCQVAVLAADKWDYPNTKGGPTYEAYHSLGRLSGYRTFRTNTSDRPETVMLWYAKQLKLSDDHDFVKAAKVESGKVMPDLDAVWTIAQDTDVEKSSAAILLLRRRDSIQVHIVVHPQIPAGKRASISISSSPEGTIVSVIESE